MWLVLLATPTMWQVVSQAFSGAFVFQVALSTATDEECTRHATLAACYQLMQSV